MILFQLVVSREGLTIHEPPIISVGLIVGIIGINQAGIGPIMLIKLIRISGHGHSVGRQLGRQLGQNYWDYRNYRQSDKLRPLQQR